jgi:opacity protein-like surface antigen
MKRILLIIAVVCAPFLTKAQFNWGHNYFEVGVGGGVMNYSGELTNSIFDFKHMHFGGALFARYNVGQFLSVRLQLALGSISGSDADSPDLRNRIRNLNFNSHLFEGSLIVEANLMGFQPRGHEKMFSPYIFAGIGVFNFNPTTTHFDPNLDGQQVFLQEINTEGQGSSTFSNRTPYSKTQISIPMGVGIKYAVSSNISIGFEVGFRPTFTDYLDDVGQTYPVNALTGEPFYDQTPYLVGQYGNKSKQELLADKTYEYIATQRGESLNQYLTSLAPILEKDPATMTAAEVEMYEEYNGYINARGGNLVRGDKLNDWYVFTMITVSYNFIENGLVGFRKRRKRKAGCKSSQF